MFMFIALGIIISINRTTTSAVQDRFQVQIGIKGGDSDTESEAVSSKCLSVKKKQFTYRIGNYSRVTDLVQCDPKPVYQYKVHELEDVPPTVGKRVCWERGCSTVVVEGRYVLLSQPFRNKLLYMEDKKNSTISFARSLVNFDPVNLIDQFAENLAETFQLDTFHEQDVRRRTFLGGRNDSCRFRDPGEATSISTWVVMFVRCIWGVSFVLFLSVMVGKRKVFYDMHNTWDWARKTYQMAEEFRGQKMYVKMVTINGRNIFYVVDDSTEEKDSGDDIEAELRSTPAES